MELVGWAGQREGGAMRGGAGVATSRCSGPDLGSPVFGVFISFALKGRLKLGCRNSLWGPPFHGCPVGTCHSYLLPQVHGGHTGIPSGQARPLGQHSCPALPGGDTPRGQTHLHAVRGLPHVGVRFLQDRAGWSPAVDLALNLFTAK